MGSTYSFILKREKSRLNYPSKLVFGRKDIDTENHSLLKMLGYLLFFRDRLEVECNDHLEMIPFTPDLIQLDYELRPALWIECGECDMKKLDRLAVKVPEAEIWVLKPSKKEVDLLILGMQKAGLRKNRYHLIAFDPEMLEELKGLLLSRNDVFWHKGTFDPPYVEFEFNGIWFEGGFRVSQF